MKPSAVLRRVMRWRCGRDLLLLAVCLHERYARLRAVAQPRIVAFRKAGNIAKNDHVADANSFRLERKPGVRKRIEWQRRIRHRSLQKPRNESDVAGEPVELGDNKPRLEPLAGGKRGGKLRPIAAFAALILRLASISRQKQKVAERFASAFAPKTRWGLFFRNQVIKAFAVPWLARLAFGRDLIDVLQLPDYRWPALSPTRSRLLRR